MTALAIMRLLPPTATMTGTCRRRRSATGKSGGNAGVRVDIGMVFQEPKTALNPMSIGIMARCGPSLHVENQARTAAREMLDSWIAREPAGSDRFP